ncbi:hypothetical protein LZ575_03085 [Antarcticibacterium sp. 1MA-6-2]|uniref:hypothetical protein n=1 Tax=Antarcticibacterium sp. 1MA-6-2 TaxID=2908210 RepID=UPI001F296260|nr:hypothetical protein [Antarcticibacterium sp. 1MA-6-2]UJH91687.1 hypothetical protein LZ575_03085 [Antarcticibacterium sp. 1MA-6-2]
MKKLLLFICIIFFSCSSDEDRDNGEMCCGTSIADIRESYHTMYGELLAKDNLTVQQRKEAEQEYAYRIENPCESYRKSLENAGASCENPN